jgi:signal transduction histidine kinase
MSGTLIAFAAGAIGILALVLMARRWGRKATEAKVIEKRLDAMREKKEIDNEVEGLPDDERRRLARRFVRKPPG